MTVYADPVAAVGVGFNTFRNSAMPTCVNIITLEAGTSIDMSVEVCTTMRQVYDFLGIQNDLTIGTPWGSFKDKLDFVNALNFNSTSIVIMARATHVTASPVVQSVVFQAKPKSALDLYTTAGDSYVSSAEMGGQFFAAYVFYAYDQTTFTSLKNDAEAEFGVGSVSFTDNFSIQMQSLVTQSGTSYSYSVKAIGFTPSAFPPPATLVDFVLAFPSYTMDSPKILSFQTQSYSTIADAPPFGQVDSYREAFVGNSAGGVTGYADDWALAQRRLTLVAGVTALYNNYGASDDALEIASATLHEDITELSNWLDSVSTDPTNPDAPVPVLKGIALGYPLPNYNLSFGTAQGGGGGDPFMDVSVTDIGPGATFSAFVVRGHGWVDGIGLVYTFDDGITPDRRTYHGGDGGDWSAAVTLASGEYVTAVSTTSGEYVNQIQITTNLNAYAAWPPFPQGAGPVVTQNTPPGSRFVGFAGRSGGYLDQIQPVYVVFSPASWMDVQPGAWTGTRLSADDLSRFHWLAPPALEDLDIDILTPIQTFCASNWTKINAIFLQKGGWEGWLQAELGLMLTKQFAQRSVEREQPVYDALGLRDDINVLQAPTGASYTHIIEVKCESLYKDGLSSKNFCKEYAVQMQKIISNKVQTKYRPAILYSLGFTCSDSVAADMAGYLFPPGLQYVPLKQGPSGYSLYMWYYTQTQK